MFRKSLEHGISNHCGVSQVDAHFRRTEESKAKQMTIKQSNLLKLPVNCLQYKYIKNE